MAGRVPSFWIKTGLAVAVVAAGDALIFPAKGLGIGLGLLSLALVAALAIANPAVRRHRLAATALGVAGLFALLQFDRPTFVGALLFVLALAVAALAPRAPVGDDGWRWFQRLIVGGLKALVGPLIDLRRVLKVRARSRPLKVTAVVLAALLPILGGAIFLWLFSTANPVIETALSSLRLPEADVGRLVFWVMLALPAWAVLRPRGLRRTMKLPGLDGDLDLPGVTTASIVVSLVVFNALFALQNGLDIAFLWSGAGLPGGMGYADYAHRGAYPLIATALLAGLFVLVFLRPGSATAGLRPVRALVSLWVAQNLFLVASTALRTVDYIEAYSLTRMRIAALIWMALVAVGLGLILWRLLRAKSSSWLLNTNLAAVGVVLALCSVVDLGSIAAAWNVRHAREVGGQGVALDLCYMRSLNGSAVVPLTELAHRLPPGEFKTRVQRVSWILWRQMREQNGSDWKHIRLRDARRYGRVDEGPGPSVFAPGSEKFFACDGSLIPPPRPAPLTPAPNPGT